LPNRRKSETPRFPRDYRGSCKRAARPLEKTVLPLVVDNGPKSPKKIDFGQVRARMHQERHHDGGNEKQGSGLDLDRHVLDHAVRKQITEMLGR
jgi:hypothetical protein